MIHNAVLVANDIAHADDPIKVRHLCSSLRICPAKAVQGFAQDLQLALHSRLDEQTRVESIDVDSFDE